MSWLDENAQGLIAIGSLVGAIAAIGAWFCTVMADRRAERRFAQRAEEIARERQRSEGENV